MMSNKMTEIQELEILVDEFAEAMKERLRSKYRQGWRGLNAMPREFIELRLLKNAAKSAVARCEKPVIDTANFAMRLWAKRK